MTGRTVLIVACLNREVPYFQGARGKGIAVLSFNEATGELTKFSEETSADNPNYLAIHEGNRRIYTVSDALGRKEAWSPTTNWTQPRPHGSHGKLRSSPPSLGFNRSRSKHPWRYGDAASRSSFTANLRCIVCNAGWRTGCGAASLADVNYRACELHLRLRFK